MEVETLQELTVPVVFTAKRRERTSHTYWNVSATVGITMIWSKSFTSKTKLEEFMDALKLAQSMGRVNELLAETT